MRGMTPDQVEAVLVEEEANIARSRARQMAMLQLADAMQLPTADGCRSLQEWATGRLDVAPETAARMVRTARRLADTPQLARRLAEGEIGFDRAEVSSRIPPSEDPDRLEGLDIPALRRLAAKHRRITAADDHRAHLDQHVQLQPNLDESKWRVWGELDSYGGTVVSKKLTERADQLPALPDGERHGLGYRRAVALVELCESDGSASPSTPLITVFVDDTGAEIEGGTPVGPAILDKVACTGALEVIKTVEGKPLGVGRRSRIVPPRLRRYVLHRDGGCVVDGCNSRYRLEAHHRNHWTEGGPTEPENLVTLCWFHHHVVVHGMGYRIDSTLGPGRIRFIKPRARDPG